MSDDRLPMPSSACPSCDAQILKALLPDGERVVLDAVKVAGGAFAAWHSRKGLSWVWHARARDETWSDDVAYQAHACAGRAGQQMRLDGAA